MAGLDDWWVIYGEVLAEFLQRAHQGEDPEMLYIELAANSRTSTFEEE